MAAIDDVIYTPPAQWRREGGRTKALASSAACFYNTHYSGVCFISTWPSGGLQAAAQPPSGLSVSPWITLSHKDPPASASVHEGSIQGPLYSSFSYSPSSPCL